MEEINIMLYGEGSFLNKGCEAIVNTTVKKIKKDNENHKIILSTNDIDYDRQFYNDYIEEYIPGYYKENELSDEEKKLLEHYKTIPFNYENFEKLYVKDTLSKIDEVDICISVGGDNYCYGDPNWIYTVNSEINKKGKKNVFWCTSLFEDINSDEMIRDLKCYDVIMVRESITYKALEKYIEKDRLMLTPDTAFSLEKKSVDLPKVFQNKKDVIGINISPLISNYTDNENNILKSIQALINEILENSDDNICLIPHVYVENNNDLDQLKLIKNLYKDNQRVGIIDDRIYDCEELKYIISNCKMLIAARTHASIAGYSTNVPTVVIGYSVKSKGIALDLFNDYENYVIPVNKLTPEILLAKYNYIKNNSDRIRQILSEKMVDYKVKADSQFDDLICRLKYLDEKYITKKSNCTGCMACYNVCPNNAIIQEKSEEGFIYPKIDKSKCVNCNLCKNICPINQNYKCMQGSRQCYAVFNKDEKERLRSSSGGVVSALIHHVIENGGVVYGASLENFELKHIRIDNIESIYKVLQSKYLQSNIDSTYRNVKNDILSKRDVLFTGTPCQVEGLKAYLEQDYDNLVCISIICHGVPSPGIFQKYVYEKFGENNGHSKNIEFRNKSNGWHKFSINYINDNSSNMIPFDEDYYMIGFLDNYFLRKSCYNCQMRANGKNRSDIIVGDYWGIENVFPDLDDDKGISAVIINSKKGSQIFDKIKENVGYKETTYKDILEYNSVLESSVKYTKKRDLFFEKIKINSFEDTVKIIKADNFNNQNKDLKNQISTMNEYIGILNNQISVMDKQIKDLLDAKEYFLGQIELRDREVEKHKENLDNAISELDSIVKSKRWKYINEIANKFNKLSKKNRRDK